MEGDSRVPDERRGTGARGDGGGGGIDLSREAPGGGRGRETTA